MRKSDVAHEHTRGEDMKEDTTESLQARPEQVVYANILEKGMLFGLLLVLATYSVYMLGILKPFVPMEEITKCWRMNVHDYLDHCSIKAGWAWVSLVGYGDFLNFIGIATLAGITIICFVSIVP
ncbi:MAG: hypothetical protein HY912_01600, partial [Desulfomonile tiedjei]|nr:hypothetical protein [Desulfomonile tiedjei]